MLPAANLNGTVPFAIPPGFDGFELYTQFVTLDGLVGASTLITAASNAVHTTVGRC